MNLNALKQSLSAVLFGQQAEEPAQPAGADLAGQLSAVKHMAIPAMPEPPAGFVWVAGGLLKPEGELTEEERRREAALRPLVEEWVGMCLGMADLKARINEVFDAEEAAFPRESARRAAGKTPSLTLALLDRSFTLERKSSDIIRFDEAKLLAAKELVYACIDRWSAGADGASEIRQVADAAFTRNDKGQFSRAGIVALGRIKSDDPEWPAAIQAVWAAQFVDGTASYQLLRVRDKDGRYHALPLDMASVRPYRRGEAA